MTNRLPNAVHPWSTVAVIKRVADGALSTYREEFNSTSPWEPESSDFIWTEGNYACDCNRELFFCRGLDIDEPEDVECTHGRYTLVSVDVNGVRIIENDKATKVTEAR